MNKYEVKIVKEYPIKEIGFSATLYRPKKKKVEKIIEKVETVKEIEIDTSEWQEKLENFKKTLFERVGSLESAIPSVKEESKLHTSSIMDEISLLEQKVIEMNAKGQIESTREDMSREIIALNERIDELMDNIIQSTKNESPVLIPVGRLRSLADVNLRSNKPNDQDTLVWNASKKRREPGHRWYEDDNTNLWTDKYVGIGKKPTEALDIMHEDADLDMTSVGTNSTTFHIRRARGSLVVDEDGNPDTSLFEVPNSGDTVLSFEAEGWNGSAWKKAARFIMSAKGDWDETQNPGQQIYQVTKTGNTSPTTFWGMYEDGTVKFFQNGSTAMVNYDTSTGKVSLKNGTAIDEFSTDGTLADNSDDAVPTEQAVKTYVDAKTDSIEAASPPFYKVDVYADENTNQLSPASYSYNSASDYWQFNGFTSVQNGFTKIFGFVLDIGDLDLTTYTYDYQNNGNTADLRIIINLPDNKEQNGVRKPGPPPGGGFDYRLYGYIGPLVRADELDNIDDFTAGNTIYVVDSGPDYEYYNVSRGDGYGTMRKLEVENLTDNPGSQELTFSAVAPVTRYSNFGYDLSSPVFSVRTAITNSITLTAGQRTVFPGIGPSAPVFDNGDTNNDYLLGGHIVYVPNTTNSTEGFYYVRYFPTYSQFWIDPITTPVMKLATNHAQFVIYSGTAAYKGRKFLRNFTNGSSNIVESTDTPVPTFSHDSIAFADSPYTAGDSAVVLGDATSGAITVNLPAASSSNGRTYTIKKIDSSANTITIDGDGSETIDGSLTNVLSSQYDVIKIICDGSNWFIV